MKQRKHVKLSPLELKVMEALWKLGRAAIREILEQIPGSNQPAYTTVQTIVFRLEAKGAVRKLRKIGNAWIFVPVITQRQAYCQLVSDFLELFSGSPWPVMSHLADTGKLTQDDLQKLERILHEAKSHRAPPAVDPKAE